MRSTYARAMRGENTGLPPIRKRWSYLLVGICLVAMGTMAPSETLNLITDPAGIAAVIGIVAGFVTRTSRALTPWALLSLALGFYGLSRYETDVADAARVAQLVAVATAIVVGAFQMRVKPESGAAARRPPRTRWGSVIVALTAAVVVITVGFPRVPLVTYLRGDPPEAVAPNPAILPSRYGSAAEIGRVRSRSLTEISGIAASTINPGVLWAHNDSGHPPVLHCLELTGADCGSWPVAGAENHDWEDMDLGPGPIPQTSYLYVGDIGDNTLGRETVTVYRTEEPAVDLAASGPESSTLETESIQLRYPDGPHDAETLLIHPVSGDLYIVTKELVSGIYMAPAPLDAGGTTTLKRVARFSILANFADRTGGDISPDGTRVAIITYGGAYELAMPPAGSTREQLEEVWRLKPSRIDISVEGQLEAITYSGDGRSIFVMSEGERSPISETRRSP